MTKIRQQYHHRKVGSDVFIWNVNVLIKVSENLPVVEIPLSEIKELDELFWYSDSDGNIPTCRSVADHAKLIEETDLKWPILVCPESRVIDGMHRVCKAYMQGLKTIRAVKFDPMPEPDYKNRDLRDLLYDDK